MQAYFFMLTLNLPWSYCREWRMLKQSWRVAGVVEVFCLLEEGTWL